MTSRSFRNSIIIVAVIVLIALPLIQKQFQKVQTTTPVNPSPSASPTVQVLGASIGKRTKTDGCIVNGKLPDAACTPGAVFPDVTATDVCKPGYSKSVRDVTKTTKNEVFAEYGVVTHTTGEYEVDHLVSLELGGSNDIANLWPEAANPVPGFHQKDLVENYLHEEVCNGVMTLSAAQNIIANNWQSITLPAR